MRLLPVILGTVMLAGCNSPQDVVKLEGPSQARRGQPVRLTATVNSGDNLRPSIGDVTAQVDDVRRTVLIQSWWKPGILDFILPAPKRADGTFDYRSIEKNVAIEFTPSSVGTYSVAGLRHTPATSAAATSAAAIVIDVINP